MKAMSAHNLKLGIQMSEDRLQQAVERDWDMLCDEMSMCFLEESIKMRFSERVREYEEGINLRRTDYGTIR
jgi:hypothetical protein